MRLEDKVAIITGAGQGIGEAYARRFAKEGARVVVADINAEKGEAVARDLGHVFERVDVAREVRDRVAGRVGPRALAVAAQVGRDEPPSRDEAGNERVPPVRVPTVAVQEERRRAVVGPHETRQRERPGRDADDLRKTTAGDGRRPAAGLRAQVHSCRNRSSARGTTTS